MVPKTPLFRSLAIQLRVIRALVLREIITRYGRHNLGILWMFLDTLLITLGLTIVLTAIKGRNTPGMTPAGFSITGYMSIWLWRNPISRCMSAITPNLSLMFHRNVRVIDIFASRIILEVSGTTIAFMVLSAVFTALGLMSPPVDTLTALYGWLLLAWFGGALAVVVGALCERFEIVEKIWRPLVIMFFPLSGAGFMVDWLPPGYREVVLWVPMVHAVELLREGYFGSVVPCHYDIGYLVIITLCLTLLGLALIRDAISHINEE